MNHIVEHLRMSRALEYCPMVGTSIFLDKESSQGSIIGLLKMIILRVFGDFPDIIPIALPEQWDSLHINVPCHEFEWPETILWNILMGILDQTAVSVYICCFIDGLDEYDRYAQDVLCLIHRLANHKDFGVRMKICVSSSPLSIFEFHFKGVRTIRLYQHT